MGKEFNFILMLDYIDERECSTITHAMKIIKQLFASYNDFIKDKHLIYPKLNFDFDFLDNTNRVKLKLNCLSDYETNLEVEKRLEILQKEIDKQKKIIKDKERILENKEQTLKEKEQKIKEEWDQFIYLSQDNTKVKEVDEIPETVLVEQIYNDLKKKYDIN